MASWTRSQLRTIIRQELMDSSGRWWSDDEINWHIEAWQDEVQRDLELVWGTASWTLSTSTVTLSSISPTPLRLDAVYLNNFRLAGRSLHDRDVLYNEWRDADAASPRMVVMPDSERFVLWPPLATTGTLALEYPQKLTLASDGAMIGLPEWAQYSAKPYVCAKVYLRPGPTNDPRKAARYWKLFQDAFNRTKDLWGHFFPERNLKLKPGGVYEAQILNPPGAWDVGSGVMAITTFEDYVPTGAIDGSNRTFTLTVTPTEMQLFKNGQCLVSGTDYTLSGYTITFVEGFQPQTGDILIAWVFRS